VSARHLLVHGVVQGVGFRWALAAQAERSGVRGWVRNREDGVVEAHLEGEDDAVTALVSWAHRGPRYARVSHVEVTVAADEGAAGFAIEP
jgi:acylphosphatase